MDLGRDAEYLWLATQGVNSNLPLEWNQLWDDEHQCAYYYNTNTNESTWIDPRVTEYKRKLQDMLIRDGKMLSSDQSQSKHNSPNSFGTPPVRKLFSESPHLLSTSPISNSPSIPTKDATSNTRRGNQGIQRNQPRIQEVLIEEDLDDYGYDIARLSELEKQVTHLQQEKLDLHAKLSTALQSADVDTKVSRAVEQDEQIKRLRLELSQATRENDDLLERIVELERMKQEEHAREHRTATALDNAHQSRIEALKQTNQDLQEAFSQMAETLGVVASDPNILVRELKNFISEREKLQTSYAEALLSLKKTQLGELEVANQNNELSSTMERMRESAETRAKELSDRLATAQSETQKFREKYETLLSTRHDTAASEASALQEELRNLRDRTKEQAMALEAAQSELRKWKARYDEIELKLEAQVSSHTKTSEEDKASVEALQQEIKDLKAILATQKPLSSDYEKLSHAYARVSDDLSASEEALEQNKRTLKDARQEIENLQDQLAGAESVLEEQTNRIIELEEEISELINEKTNLTMQCKSNETVIEELENENERLRTDLESYAAELHELQNSHMALKEEVRLSENSSSHLKNTILTLEKRCDELSHQLVQQEQDHQAIFDEEIALLQQRLEAKQQEYDMLHNEFLDAKAETLVAAEMEEKARIEHDCYVRLQDSKREMDDRRTKLLEEEMAHIMEKQKNKEEEFLLRTESLQKQVDLWKEKYEEKKSELKKEKGGAKQLAREVALLKENLEGIRTRVEEQKNAWFLNSVSPHQSISTPAMRGSGKASEMQNGSEFLDPESSSSSVKLDQLMNAIGKMGADISALSGNMSKQGEEKFKLPSEAPSTTHLPLPLRALLENAQDDRGDLATMERPTSDNAIGPLDKPRPVLSPASSLEHSRSTEPPPTSARSSSLSALQSPVNSATVPFPVPVTHLSYPGQHPISHVNLAEDVYNNHVETYSSAMFNFPQVPSHLPSNSINHAMHLPGLPKTSVLPNIPRIEQNLLSHYQRSHAAQARPTPPIRQMSTSEMLRSKVENILSSSIPKRDPKFILPSVPTAPAPKQSVPLNDIGSRSNTANDNFWLRVHSNEIRN